MFKQFLHTFVAGIFLVSLMLTAPIQAQSDTTSQTSNIQQQPTEIIKPKIKVATKITPPLVDNKDNKLQGYSIDIWNEVSKRNGIESEISIKSNVAEILTSVENGETEVGISAISQTSDREKKVDFSHPYLDAGLQVITPKKAFSAWDTFQKFINSSAFKILELGLVIILVTAHIYLFIKWRHKDLNHDGYFANLWDSIWYCSVGMITTSAGESKPRSRVGQFLGVIWLLMSLIIVTQFQAVITADLTINQIQDTIKTVSDLNGRSVGVLEKTTSQAFTDDNSITTEKYTKISDLLNDVSSGKLDTALIDAPVAQYYTNHDGKETVNLGPVLKKENYGIVFKLDGKLRKLVNESLLEMQQDGTLEDIRIKWFGESI
jgi:polar amino acid transport system substrate-binding protein